MATPAVFVFIQAGCPACHDFMPKFERTRTRHPQVTVGVYDISLPDPQVQHFAEALGVRATPTTIVQTSNGAHKRYVGSLPVAQIDEALRAAR